MPTSLDLRALAFQMKMAQDSARREELSMKSLVLALCAAALSACVAHIDQRKLEAVPQGQQVIIRSPLSVIENRGLSKLEWKLLPGTYVERFSSAQGRVFLSEGHLVQATTTLGEQTLHPGGYIIRKDRPGFATLYIVRGKSGQQMSKSVLLDVAAGVEGDLTLVSDFPLSQVAQHR